MTKHKDGNPGAAPGAPTGDGGEMPESNGDGHSSQALTAPGAAPAKVSRKAETQFGGPRAPVGWRGGRPKKFAEWRDLNVKILNEVATDRHGKPIEIDGHQVTNAEMIVRQWLHDPKHQLDIIEAAFGKVPQLVHVQVGDQDIDDAIRIELARLAGDRQAAPALPAADDPDADADHDPADV